MMRDSAPNDNSGPEAVTVAVASHTVEGLNSQVSQHFGHCPYFTIVSLKGNRIENVSVLENPPHRQGGCAAPVALLKERGVSVLIVGGMGLRPLMILNREGIRVYAGASGSVRDTIENYISGKLPIMDESYTCKH